MRIPLLLARAQLRRGWRSLVGIALLIALVGGLTLAGVVWQGTTIGGTALLFGVPLGIVVGRWF